MATTFDNIANSKTTIYIKPKEGVIQSFCRDLVTFSFLGLCIYASQGSTFWTLVTGTMFIVLIAAKLSGIMTSNSTTFKNLDDAICHLEKLKESK